MTIRVLIFGSLARELSCKEIAVEVAAPATVSGVNRALAAKYPAKASFMSSARLAVNHAFAKPEAAVQPGDEVALIELVGGG
ncbi:MAG: MoaD/ThiS family protein [Planctomycetes bacterium]|nr:MoaD/ThiS family protein [Planctomycetota bacterium]